MRRRMTPVAVLIATVLVLLSTSTVWALGTADDQTISNTASVEFTINGTTTTTSSNTETFEIDTKVRPFVATNGDTGVVAGVADFALPFTVTNESNSAAGSDYFKLTLEAADGATTPADDFDMENVTIYLDADNSGTLTAGDSDLGTGPVVSIDNTGTNSKKYLIVGKTPDAGGTPDTATANLEAIYHLVATAWAGANDGDGALLDDSVANGGDGLNSSILTEVVYADDAGTAPSGDSAKDGLHSAYGTFTTLATLAVTKSASNGTSTYHIPGDEVTYTITTTNGDPNFDATDITISDQIPLQTTFKSGSLSCPAGFDPEYSADAKGSPASTWSGPAETATVNHVQCANGTIAQGDPAVNMTFIITID